MLFRSLRTKILVCAVSTMMLSFLTAYAVTYVRDYHAFRQQLLKDESIVLGKLAQNINYIILDTRWLAVDVVLDDDIQSLLKEKVVPGSFQAYRNSYNITQRLQRYMSSRSITFNVSVIKNNGELISGRGLGNDGGYQAEKLKEDWFAKYLQTSAGAREYFTEVIRYDAGATGIFHVVNYIKPLYDKDNPSTRLGTVLVSVDFKNIADVFKKLDTEFARYSLSNSTGAALLDIPDSSLRFDPKEYKKHTPINDVEVFENRDSFALVSLNLESGWRLTEQISKKKITGMIWTGLASMVYTGIIGVVIAAAIMTALLFRMTGSIKKLREAMKKVSAGKLDTSIHIQSHDEIEALSDVFNIMVRNIRELIDKVALEEKEKKNFEMRSLIMQINPHFINNTLSSVIYLARKNKTDEIIDLIGSLINVMNKTIRFKDEFTTIREEMLYIREYAKIQKIRYGEMFGIEFDAAESLYSYMIPRMLLQPLVENALFHGIFPKEAPGTIRIRVKREDHHLHIAVSDDGVGVEPERVQELLMKETEHSIDRFSSIGLKNVNDRIRLLYGDGYGLQMESRPMAGMTIRFSVPAVN